MDQFTERAKELVEQIAGETITELMENGSFLIEHKYLKKEPGIWVVFGSTNFDTWARGNLEDMIEEELDWLVEEEEDHRAHELVSELEALVSRMRKKLEDSK